MAKKPFYQRSTVGQRAKRAAKDLKKLPPGQVRTGFPENGADSVPQPRWEVRMTGDFSEAELADLQAKLQTWVNQVPQTWTRSFHVIRRE